MTTLRRLLLLSAAALLLPFLPCVSAATLSWAPSTGDVGGYYVYYGTTAYSTISRIDVGGSTRYDLDALPLSAGVNYHFWVTAYNAAGESRPSQTISYTRGDSTPPAPPSGLTAN